MLFPYTYVPNRMERMQEFIDFIFFKVWCKAPDGESFGLSLFVAHPELHEVMKAFYYSDTEIADFFYSHVEKIYLNCAKLKPKQIRRMKWWYYSNNEIERLCSKDWELFLVRYADIERRLPHLTKDIKAFFTRLYGLNSADLKKTIGSIDEHYHSFIRVNNAGKCPFCGLIDLHGEDHRKREAYDHYLPKALYLFNSINFRNLVPTCHYCNSSYKLQKDPAHSATDASGTAQRRKLLDRYTKRFQRIEIFVSIAHSLNIMRSQSRTSTCTLLLRHLLKEIDTWRGHLRYRRTLQSQVW